MRMTLFEKHDGSNVNVCVFFCRSSVMATPQRLTPQRSCFLSISGHRKISAMVDSIRNAFIACFSDMALRGI